MKAIGTFIMSIVFLHAFGQEIIYQDQFDENILSVGDNPNGYSMTLENKNFQITGDGAAGPWTAMAYFMHDGNGNNTLIDVSTAPKLYLKARGDGNPALRIDLQDQTGYVTNLNPTAINLDDDYRIYELDYSGRLSDGAFGGPCTSSPCAVDATNIQALIIFVNAANGGYSGNIEIEWLSLGAPLEDISSDENESYDIRYNQVSYLTNRPKLINIVSEINFENIPYSIFRTGETDAILEGIATNPEQWQPSREFVTTIDVSELNIEGSYTFVTPAKEINFQITSDGYNTLGEAALKYFYFNRASQELTEAFAGPWARPLGHPDDEVLIHQSAASDTRPTGTIISSPKGWYDAGDYNKYIVNSGISTYTLLAAYEHYTDYYNQLNINIPEQGGDLPDILDEILWNLDWMISMQDPADGGVYHKLTGLNFSGIIMPHQYNFQRYVVQKTTAAALNLAAVAATAARIFEAFENVMPGYSAQLIEVAEAAYNWAKENPRIFYQQPSDVRTGQYGDGNVSDEFDWAAVELFITTGAATYLNDLEVNNIGSGVPAWPYTAPLALVSLAHHAEQLRDQINLQAVFSKLISTADGLKSAVNESALRVAMGASGGDFVWGSNGQAGNQIMMLIRAYEFSQDETYLDAAYTAMDYLLGRNGTGFCYVSGFGDQPMRNPHHRASEADNVVEPVPGMVAGGPNPGQQDGCSGYPNNFPASSYIDDWCSYASNEVTINWNAPLAYSINALQFYQTETLTKANDFLRNGVKNLKIYPNPGLDIIQLPQINEYSVDRLEIYNLQGQLIKQKDTVPNANIDVSGLAPGSYFMKLHTSNTVLSGKWIKAE